jgi:hypothetical protein
MKPDRETSITTTRADGSVETVPVYWHYASPGDRTTQYTPISRYAPRPARKAVSDDTSSTLADVIGEIGKGLE